LRLAFHTSMAAICLTAFAFAIAAHKKTACLPPSRSTTSLGHVGAYGVPRRTGDSCGFYRAVPERSAFAPPISARIAAYVILYPFTFSIDAECRSSLVDRARDDVQTRLQGASARSLRLHLTDAEGSLCQHGTIAENCIIEIRPTGHFATYGVGVSLMDMRDPEKARGRAPVG